MRLTLRNVSYPAVDPGEADLIGHWQRRERTVQMPVEQTALILVLSCAMKSEGDARPVARLRWAGGEGAENTEPDGEMGGIFTGDAFAFDVGNGFLRPVFSRHKTGQ